MFRLVLVGFGGAGRMGLVGGDEASDARARELARALKSLDQIKPIYIVPRHDLVGEALIPCFQAAEQVDCMMGFFSSASLATLAPGLAAFINGTSGTLRLIVSPFLSPADQAALAAGTETATDIGSRALEAILVTEEALERHTLDCLSYLLRTGRIELRVALMKDALFHLKAWLFRQGLTTIAIHGSGNMTAAGIGKNVEQLTVSRIWADPTQRFIVDELDSHFDRLWRNLDDDCLVVPVSKAISERLLQAYRGEAPPSEAEFEALYNRAKNAVVVSPPTCVGDTSRPEFHIPAYLQYDDGPYAHQGKAVAAWTAAGYRGVLEMATGSGKTITSMIGAYRLAEMHGPLLIVVAAPYLPLIDQWCDEIAEFGLQPINLTTAASASARARIMAGVSRRLRYGTTRAEAVVVSHDTLCSPEFAAVLSRVDVPRLLIADEAHNLGRESFIRSPPSFFEHRLALSATPVRQYDDQGTAALLEFFGDVVFRFTLEEAIGVCLVGYDYHLHPVELNHDEMDVWYELTSKIRANAWRSEAGKPDEYLSKLLRDRRALLETAGAKIAALNDALDHHDHTQLKHALVYASDKGPSQLEAVNALLKRRRLLFHQLTAEETRDRALTRSIIRSFQDSEIQVLTAKRVLDEGVNIPQIRLAYILASTTVGRQWIQRRGRLLRTCSAIGKTHSVIHDFLALPPDFASGGLDDDAKALIRSELKRVQEFAQLARNAGANDGPLKLTAKLVATAFG